MIRTDAQLKSYFEDGDFPTESQFADLIDSKQTRNNYPGPFVSDGDAGTAGVPQFAAYRLSENNIYGIPSPDGRTLSIRVNEGSGG